MLDVSVRSVRNPAWGRAAEPGARTGERTLTRGEDVEDTPFVGPSYVTDEAGPRALAAPRPAARATSLVPWWEPGFAA